MNNILIKGDNIKAMNYLLDRGFSGKIDLVYIDPPFATGNRFTISGERTSTISKSLNDDIAYTDKILGKDFLDFLRPRLFLIKELMSDRASIYLHIDYKIGHYVKILMDEVFGIKNFRNDITRIKCNPKNFRRIGYGNVKDCILFYTKGSNPIWNEPFENYTEEDIKRLFPKIDKNGRRYTTVPIHAPGETVNGRSNKPFKGILPPKGRHWRTDVETLEKWDRDGLIEWSSNGNPRKIIYPEERIGKRVQDVWQFKDPQYPRYPTEKNLDMIDLIIRTSSNPESIVLDCFCGSGTTLIAANRRGRKWIGIDQSEQSIKITMERLNNEKCCYDFIDIDCIKHNCHVPDDSMYSPAESCFEAGSHR
jgi:adenine-specific DNA-methyltransferase